MLRNRQTRHEPIRFVWNSGYKLSVVAGALSRVVFWNKQARLERRSEVHAPRRETCFRWILIAKMISRTPNALIASVRSCTPDLAASGTVKYESANIELTQIAYQRCR